MLDRAEPDCAPVLLLDALLPLGAQERSALALATGESVRQVSARRDVACEGDRRSSILFVLQGWGCRYRLLPDGRRQVVSIMLPGDICDVDTGAMEIRDHSIGAVTAMTVAEVGLQRFARLRDQYPNLSRAVGRYQRAQMAIQREWTTSLGQRSAIERLAHLFCELFLRMDSIGAADGNSCDLPLTQADLADACGLTTVHVNRTLQELRREGLVGHVKRRLVIPDLGALKHRGLFDPAYLHLAGRTAIARNG